MNFYKGFEPTGGPDDYYDVWDGRDRIFLIMPDGSYETDTEEQAHGDLLDYDTTDNFDGTMKGWCRGYTVHEDEQICFFPMAGWNLMYEDTRRAYRLTKFTEFTAKGINQILKDWGVEGYNVYVEFEDFFEEWVYDGNEFVFDNVKQLEYA